MNENIDIINNMTINSQKIDTSSILTTFDKDEILIKSNL